MHGLGGAPPQAVRDGRVEGRRIVAGKVRCVANFATSSAECLETGEGRYLLARARRRVLSFAKQVRVGSVRHLFPNSEDY